MVTQGNEVLYFFVACSHTGPWAVFSLFAGIGVIGLALLIVSNRCHAISSFCLSFMISAGRPSIECCQRVNSDCG